ncbi:hypothetical protein GPA27_25815 [Aromatoleum toluolicum]|uniref:Uncharacterized protein n=1 Tax=Aromatoleum toluolicum TaxID=90060 RepID=A0ABX1NN56_9RHOO|nr:hypothetical protein [Aromatoleum toluolicum]NMG00804.1 hypothetical protein [Aromatoleum toluolicum]
MEMAKNSYEYVLKLKKRRQKDYGSEASWSSLESDVREFVRAKTKTEKERWLTKRNVPQARAIAAETNLPAGDNGWTHYVGQRLDLSPPQGSPTREERKEMQAAGVRNSQFEEFLKKNAAPREAVQAVEHVLEEWIRGRTDLMQELLATELSVNRSPVSREVFSRVLRSFTFPDHGAVNEARHGILSSQRDFSGTLQVPDWKHMFRPITAEHRITVIRSQSSNQLRDEVVAAFQFVHAPNDLVLLTVERRKTRWVVKDLTNVIVH